MLQAFNLESTPSDSLSSVSSLLALLRGKQSIHISCPSEVLLSLIYTQLFVLYSLWPLS